MTVEPKKPSAARIAAFAAAVIVGIGAVSFVVAQSSRSGAKAEAAAAAPRAVPVTVAKPTVKAITEWDEYTGRFQAIDSVEVRARVSGYLVDVAFTDGDIVKSGDLLYKIDPRPFQADVDAALADLASADAALQNARAEQERGARLVERQALSEEEAGRRERALLQAQAARAASKARVDQARLNLEFTEVRAPISGRISDDFVGEGNLIVGGAQGGTLLTRIVSLDPIYFEFTASEAAYLKYVRLAQTKERSSSRDAENPVLLKLIDEGDFVHQGRMSFVDNQLDPSTGTMRGRATFDNSQSVFIPGMFGHLRLIGSGEYLAILIPDSAVQTDQHEKFVWVANAAGAAERRRVELGPISDGLRVVRSGVDADSRVVISGAQFIAANAPLAIEQQDTSNLTALGNQ